MRSTSPSIYLVYDTLAAVSFDYPIFSPQVTVGSVYYNATIAYPPDEISTLPQGCYHGLGDYLPLNLEDFASPPQNWQITSKCAVFLSQAVGNWDGPNGTEMALTPLIKPPSGLSTYDPAWSTCSGFYVYNILVDPPRVLTPVSALAPITTNEPEVPSSAAKPHGQPSIIQATSTSVQGPHSTSDPVAGPAGGNGVTPGSQPDPASHDAVDPLMPVLDNGDSKDPQLHAPGTFFIPQATPIATIEGHTVSRVPGGDILVDGKSFNNGDQASIFNGMDLSVGSSAIEIGRSSYVLPALHEVDALQSIGGEEVRILPQGGVAIGNSTFTAGDEVTLESKTIFVGSTNIVIDSITYAAQALSRTISGVATSLPSIGGIAASRLPNGDVILGDSTIKPGAATEIDATRISVGSNVVVVAGNTYAWPSPTTTTRDRIQGLIGGGAVVEGVTISPNAQTTISGTVISLGSGVIAVNGMTLPLPPGEASS